MQSMDVGKCIFLCRLRKSYVNGAVRRLRSRHRHWAWRILWSKFDVILSMRVHAPFVKRVIYVGSRFVSIQHAPYQPTLNYAGLRRPI